MALARVKGSNVQRLSASILAVGHMVITHTIINDIITIITELVITHIIFLEII